MHDIASIFTTIKLGPLSVAAACFDGQLLFLTEHLLDRLKFDGLTLEAVFCSATAYDKAGKKHEVVTEEGLYFLLLQSDAKEARPFQNWVSQCVLPAVLLDRFYQVGEEKNGTHSHDVLDPKDEYGNVPEAFHSWLAEAVLPSIRRCGRFFTDLEELFDDQGLYHPSPKAVSKELELLVLRSGVGRKISRFHQQPSKRRFARVAKQFSALNDLTDPAT
ncbi:BRO family protein [Amylibacter sp. IMCC11727]|uniref:BRO family protein n=1 Tax=Amylibacter sp. IMCC11727 TaxID=3039851 RepID=UPI00244E0472|nr:BRO family protein [Amylibacter sp. IMCC11727]WGI21215.1 BRO family protein [Amylibacter sp. IMCC11727]